MSKKFLRGATDGSTIVIILLSVALVGIGAFSVWSYMNYREAQTGVDLKINEAVATAKKEEGDSQAKIYAERAKEPNLTFNAPDDYGKVRFAYPKTWSSFVESDGSDGSNFHAYLHPVTVPPIPKKAGVSQRYALRVSIYNASIDEVLNEYQKTIEKGELSSTSAVANGKSATKIEGLFPNPSNKDDRIKGVAYFFKVNDKVLMMKSDADTFRGDFDKLIQTIDFN